jgi:hypothetical protein
MRRLLVVLVLIGGLVPLLSGAAWACSCEGYASDQEQYAGAAESAKVIYTGLVVAEARSTPSPAPSSGSTPVPHPNDEQVYYTVRVDESLKGGATGDRTVSSSASGASCGAYLEVRRRALVIEHLGDRHISLCDGTTQERVDPRAAIVRAHLAGQSPSLPHTGGGLSAVAVVALATVVGLAALRRGAAT